MSTSSERRQRAAGKPKAEQVHAPRKPQRNLFDALGRFFGLSFSGPTSEGTREERRKRRQLERESRKASLAPRAAEKRRRKAQKRLSRVGSPSSEPGAAHRGVEPQRGQFYREILEHGV